MSEDKAELQTQEEPQQSILSKRAPWWRSALAALGITAAVLGANELLNQPNNEQRKAEAALADPNIVKKNYTVSNDPEIEQSGGLAVRNEPKPDIKGESPSVVNRLAPGIEIQNAIPWTGKSPDNPDQTGESWVAFKDTDGQTRFVAIKYLDEVQRQTPATSTQIVTSSPSSTNQNSK